MIVRQPIRNTSSASNPRVFDALIEGDEVYLEIKNAKQREIIRLADVLRQVEAAKRASQYQNK